ncbi:MAG: hypothetical protein CML72_01355, partial [Rhodobacterales bacterium]|nr:hypothetical protein [Rhodobacterales bacterium]
MLETLLKILKSIKNNLLILIITSTILTSEVIAKEISNLSWYKSNYVGKQLPDFRETVTSPALGKEAWKITLLPRDCGREREGDYSDCK